MMRIGAKICFDLMNPPRAPRPAQTPTRARHAKPVGINAVPAIMSPMLTPLPVIADATAQPMTGGSAPAAPPITMFCAVFLFNQIV